MEMKLRRNKQLSGHSGSLLVEGLLAMALLSSIFIFLPQLISQWMRGQQFVSRTIRTNVLVNQARLLLSSGSSCRCNFRNIKFRKDFSDIPPTGKILADAANPTAFALRPYNEDCTIAGPPILSVAPVNQADNSTIAVREFRLNNVFGISDTAPDEFIGRLQVLVGLPGESLVTSLKPRDLNLSISADVTSDPQNAIITSCTLLVGEPAADVMDSGGGFTSRRIYNETGRHTFRVPAGVTSIKVLLVGGSGGGGNGNKCSYSCGDQNNHNNGGGGGGGAVAVAILKVNPKERIPLMVGGGGSRKGNGRESSVGPTSYEGVIRAGGGLAGESVASANCDVTPAAGGAGGTVWPVSKSVIGWPGFNGHPGSQIDPLNPAGGLVENLGTRPGEGGAPGDASLLGGGMIDGADKRDTDTYYVGGGGAGGGPCDIPGNKPGNKGNVTIFY